MELAGSASYHLPLTAARCRAASGPLERPGRLSDIAQILTVTVDGAVVDPADVVIDGRVLRRTDARWTRPTVTDPFNVVVEYEYGVAPPSWEAREAGLRLFAANATPSDVSAYATSWNNEDGTFRIATWPVKVEEWLKRHPRRPAVA